MPRIFPNKGLLSPTLSSKGGEGEEPRRPSPSPPLEERVGERRPFTPSFVQSRTPLPFPAVRLLTSLATSWLSRFCSASVADRRANRPPPILNLSPRRCATSQCFTNRIARVVMVRTEKATPLSPWVILCTWPLRATTWFV